MRRAEQLACTLTIVTIASVYADGEWPKCTSQSLYCCNPHTTPAQYCRDGKKCQECGGGDACECASKKVKFTVTEAAVSSTGEHFPHTWEEGVGSGHMAMALRADYREQLKRVREELGFKRVRMHGMMNDDMSTSLGPGLHSYYNLNSVIDYIDSLGMDVLFEIGFMPKWLAPTNYTVDPTKHYEVITSPPKNYTLWNQVMEELAKHLLSRYGPWKIERWYFEVWNEPGPVGQFWSGNPRMESYFEFYENTVKAFHRVSPLFRMGGPVSASLGYIPEFKEFCAQTNTPYTFISSHEYGGGGSGAIYKHDWLAERFATARAEVGDEVPFFITEWGGSWSHEAFLDEPSYAPFLIRSVALNVNTAAMLLPWTFSDIFEETGMPMTPFDEHPNFGLMTVYGTPKPSYRAFQLLHWSGDRRIVVEQKGAEGTSCADTMSAVALKNSTHVQLLVTNTGPMPLPDSGLTDHVTDCQIVVSLPVRKAIMTRIDTKNANTKGAWVKMGSPPYPNASQLAEMEAASNLVLDEVVFDGKDVGFHMPARGVLAFFAEIIQIPSTEPISI